MRPWLIFLIAGFLLTLALVGGLLLFCRERWAVFRKQKLAGEAWFLYLLLWLASLSMLAYIAFAFGKR